MKKPNSENFVGKTVLVRLSFSESGTLFEQCKEYDAEIRSMDKEKGMKLVGQAFPETNLFPYVPSALKPVPPQTSGEASSAEDPHDFDYMTSWFIWKESSLFKSIWRCWPDEDPALEESTDCTAGKFNAHMAKIWKKDDLPSFKNLKLQLLHALLLFLGIAFLLTGAFLMLMWVPAGWILGALVMVLGGGSLAGQFVWRRRLKEQGVEPFVGSKNLSFPYIEVEPDEEAVNAFVEKHLGRTLMLDPDAESGTPGDPPFIRRPKGAPAYHGFSVIKETETDGWYFGAITNYLDADGCEEGDAFVVAPDGTRAGLLWEVGYEGCKQVSAPSPDRWGVYAVGFARSVKTMDDLIFNFREILPELKRKHASVLGE